MPSARVTKLTFSSRGGKSYNDTLQHLVPDLLTIIEEGEVYDGEVYIHGKSLQTITSYVKKLRPESKQLQYWVYDIADENRPYDERYAQYEATIEEAKINDLKAAHDKFVQEGFEGAIIRNKKGLYKFDSRPADLQKFKMFEDKEFRIVGAKTAETGRYEGCCIFICEVEPGKTFDVCPRGSVKIRKQYYIDSPNLIDNMLTVRFQEYSDAGIPLFPVGIVVRDYE